MIDPRRQHPGLREQRDALERVAAEAAEHPVPAGEAAFAFAPYGDGFLAMAVVGVIEDVSAERLAGALRDVRGLGRRELAIELSGLVWSTPALVRILGQLRLAQLASAGRLELHRPPATLMTTLGDSFPDELSLHDPRPALRAV